LTLTSGGIINGFAGNEIKNGDITTGMSSGELFVHTPASMNLGAVIKDNGGVAASLVKGGVGTLSLTGANTYTGRTYVNAGTLQLDGGSLFNGNITITGGTMSATANGGTLNFRINNDSADLISISAVGGLDLSNIKLNLVLTGIQSLASEYVLADKAVGSGFVSGNFAASTVLPDGWSIDYDGTPAHVGKIVLLNAVPEPASFAVIGFTVVGMLSRRRCRRPL